MGRKIGRPRKKSKHGKSHTGNVDLRLPRAPVALVEAIVPLAEKRGVSRNDMAVQMLLHAVTNITGVNPCPDWKPGPKDQKTKPKEVEPNHAEGQEGRKQEDVLGSGGGAADAGSGSGGAEVEQDQGGG